MFMDLNVYFHIYFIVSKAEEYAQVLTEAISKLDAESKEIEEAKETLSNISEHSKLVDLEPYFELDFKKIKHHLSEFNLERRVLLLQALRWVSYSLNNPQAILEYVANK